MSGDRDFVPPAMPTGTGGPTQGESRPVFRATPSFLAAAMKKPPGAQRSNIPPLPIPHAPTDARFVRQVRELIYQWVQDEWPAVQAIKQEATDRAWTATRRKAAIALATLTITTLTRRLKDVSRSALFKELSILGAPRPGQMIRTARLDYAAHLLIHTRLPIREIVVRVGYRDEDNFKENFKAARKVTPSQFRIAHRRGIPSSSEK